MQYGLLATQRLVASLLLMGRHQQFSFLEQVLQSALAVSLQLRLLLQFRFG